jgi:hypothetical protein
MEERFLARRITEAYPIVKTKKSENEDRLLYGRTAIDGRWCLIAPCLMLPPLIGALKAWRSPRPRLVWRRISFHRDLLVCDRPPPPCATAVVERSSPPVHAPLPPCGCQTSRDVETRALCPLRTLAHVRAPHLQRWLQRLQAQAHVQRHGQCPRPPRATAPIPHGDQGERPTMPPDVRDIGTPDLVPPCDRHPPQPVRVDPRCRRGGTHPWLGIPRLSPPRAQPPRHTVWIDRVALPPYPGGHPTHPLGWRVGVWRSQPPPHREMRWTLPLRRVVIGGP